VSGTEQDPEPVMLTRDEAVGWVMGLTRSSRTFVVKTVNEAEHGQTPYGMTYDGTGWVVPEYGSEIR
jgi:hypothetical protein